MHFERAPFFRRLAARLIDLGFSLVLTFLLVIPGSIILAIAGPFLEPLLGRPTLIGIAVIICYFTAYVGLEVFLLVRRQGQTLGKGLMGLRVVSSTTGHAVSPAPAVIRMLLIFLPFVFASIAGGNPDAAVADLLASIGFLALLASLVLAAIPSAQRRTVHDLAAGSRVVRAAKRRIDFKQDVRMLVPGKIDMVKGP
jgi:uncharacterized RDD family membrane protein YckC